MLSCLSCICCYPKMLSDSNSSAIDNSDIYYSLSFWGHFIAISIPFFSLGVLLVDYNEKCYKWFRSWKFVLLVFIALSIVMYSLYY